LLLKVDSFWGHKFMVKRVARKTVLQNDLSSNGRRGHPPSSATGNFMATKIQRCGLPMMAIN
jgi:hypothetical protein